MEERLRKELRAEISELHADGTYKREVPLTTRQAAHIATGTASVINFCANNYLGLASHPALIAAGKLAMDQWGLGMASVRFICGTNSLHLELERAVSKFLATEDTILYGSCFDANAGLFEALTDERDAIISDELNHASIIDGVRLSKARRLRYKNRDMADLEAQLLSSKDARRRIVATDGVFSMDGYLAPLPQICELAEKHSALVMVDDSHAVGFTGPNGAGTPDLFNVRNRVDILTGTFGKALGGASGGYTSARREIIDVLRQRSRPYLFSNSLAPSIAGATLAALELITESPGLLAQLRENTAYFRSEMQRLKFELSPGDHSIIPVLVGDATKAARMADLMLASGVYVRAFSYPVVPKGRARIRTQMSAAHSRSDLDFAVAAFAQARDRLG